MKPIFTKRIYNPMQFFSDIGFAGVRLFAVIDAYRSARIPWAFAEKIMLATTAVNDCVYCARLHTRLAQVNDVSDAEISGLLSSDIGRYVDGYEYRALCFAQHYAETDRQPDAEEVTQLVDYYGPEKANDIMLYIRLIYIGNLMGNTFDALRSRVRGQPHPDSRLWFELLLFLVFFPGMLLAGVPIVLGEVLLSGVVPSLRRVAPSSHFSAHHLVASRS